jgi:hypothetical protein
MIAFLVVTVRIDHYWEEYKHDAVLVLNPGGSNSNQRARTLTTEASVARRRRLATARAAESATTKATLRPSKRRMVMAKLI